jgi:dienelactone hydrolase
VSIGRYLKAIYDPKNQQYAFNTEYPGGFRRWQTNARHALIELIGLDNIIEHTKTHQPTIKLQNHDDKGQVSICKGHIETEPYVSIPFWILRPNKQGPFPLAIIAHGHDDRGYGPDTYAGVYHNDKHRNITLTKNQDIAIQAVKHGFITIVPAIRGLTPDTSISNVSKQYHGRNCHNQAMHCLLAGRTMVSERIWDISRILDWATKLPEVNKDKILMIGHSAGAVVAKFAAACDERITIAIPNCSDIMTVSHKWHKWNEWHMCHCPCNIIPNILHWGNFHDVCGLIAPRHLLTIVERERPNRNNKRNVQRRKIGINQSADHIRSIYDAADANSHYQHKWGPIEHKIHTDLIWPFVSNILRKPK